MATEANDQYGSIMLGSQLCFPLYACSKEIIRKYKPYLDKLDLTYTQYITMMVMWEKQKVNVKMLGQSLFLDSGTLTPVLKKLETKGYIRRERSVQDERNLEVTITDKGMALREEAVSIPPHIKGCVDLEEKDFAELYRLLYLVLNHINTEEEVSA